MRDEQTLGTWRLTEDVTYPTKAHMNNWDKFDIHHVSNLPVFSALFLPYYYIHFIRWLHNMDLWPVNL
jgi:hypothetical protein